MALPEELPHNLLQPNMLGIDLNALPPEKLLELHQRRLLALSKLPNSVDKSKMSIQTLELLCEEIRDTNRVLDEICWNSKDKTRTEKLRLILEKTERAEDALTLGKNALEFQKDPLEAREKLYKYIRECQKELREALSSFEDIM